MKRILAIFNGKLESLKKERKIKRLMRSIEIAVDNAEDAKETIDNKMDDLADTLPQCEDTNSFVQEMSDLIGQKEEQELIITRLTKIKAYLEEEVEVKEKK